jgi:glycosyltransferase involved in cell wall biosynthesis
MLPAGINASVLAEDYAALGIDTAISTGLHVAHRVNFAHSVTLLASELRKAHGHILNNHSPGNHIPLQEALAGKLAGYSVFTTVHHAMPYTNLKSRVLTRAASVFTKRVIAHSQSMRGVLLSAGVHPDRVQVIPIGIPEPTSYPNQSNARAQLGLPPTGFIVGTVARLNKEKGIDTLIEAIANINSQGQDITLVVAGDGFDRVELEAQGKRTLNDHARFLGRVENKEAVFAASDIFCLPSRSEGFGLVYLEAGLHNVPSIGADVGGVAEAIDDHETGLLVEPDNPQQLAEAIKKLRDDPSSRQRLGENAREKAIRDHSVGAMIDAYCKLLCN